ncbi:hypothetical protein [Spongiivirga citrea]|uniref:Uncharacterized protein n=1 Tax=Spongiivirga citrea TaxID=1481457 RepID=A0A6M0CHV6_9FLAO|nr:hypothetical protein [Spongiivirga citrea]NER17538.1 hypothetical protein [Spongiivirga citrea]
MISELNENKIIQIRVHLKIILEEGFKIIEENNDKFNVYQSLYKRYIYCFDSLSLLLKEFGDDKIYRTNSIAIILRASLLDYLTTIYLRTFQLEMKAGLKSNYTEELKKLLSEQIRRFLIVREADRKTPRYDHESFCSMVNKIYLEFDFLFDKSVPLDYNKPIKSLKYSRQDDISSQTIRKRLDSFSENLKNIDYHHVFELYDIFSKYDHFGIISMFLEELEINEVCDYIFWSIFHIVDGITFCEELLKDEVNSKSNFEKIGYELSSLKGTIYTESLYLSEQYKSENK